MTDDLLYFQVGMLFSCIIVEQSFEVSNEVMPLVGNLHICHNDVVGCVSPAILERHVSPVSFAGKIESLDGVL